MGVNLYVTLPHAGHCGHGSFFSNGQLQALHAVLGILLMLAAIAMLVRAIMDALIATGVNAGGAGLWYGGCLEIDSWQRAGWAGVVR